ncbi:MAG TPA: hypothetical protein VFK02_37030 [Kofleriaceae bacterium]|nr:hypothetical protein [Kofleriaceae bacterium]
MNVADAGSTSTVALPDAPVVAELDRVRRIDGLDDVQAVLPDQVGQRPGDAHVERVAMVP